jgi:hypothetical protein
MAKCEDLNIEPKEGQLTRFYDFCSKTIIDTKIVLRELGLGVKSALILA